MKTSTIMWTLAVLVILMGAGSYYYSTTLTEGTAPSTADTSTNEIPNPGGTNLPAGDLTPTPTTPIASSTVQVGASSTFQ